jgi:hypothetical protein
MKSQLSITLTALALLGLGVSMASPQQPEAPKDQSEAKKGDWLHEAYLKDASEYDFFLDDAKKQRLKLLRDPVMRWTSGGDYKGEVYVWTHQGTAAVVGCIFSGPQGKTSRSVMHEFHSLAPNPLHAGARGGTGWLSQEPGIRLEPLADAPEPAKNQVRRLTQMRDIARRFTSQVDRENARSEMRLLPQPIYRYEVADEGSPVVDGAVFAFVWTAGTDPEVLLVIEARRTDQGVRWFYAPARFTNREAWLKYQDREVWRAEPATVGIFDGVTTKRYGAFSVKTIANPGEER